MLITCPACAATYDLPQALVVKLPARTRCARCGAEWEVMPPAAPRFDEPEPVAVPPPAFEVPEPVAAAPVAPLPQPERRQVSGSVTDRAPADRERVSGGRIAPDPMPDPRLVRMLWGGSIGMIVVLIGLLLLLHGPIADAWPPSLRFFRAIGLG